MRVRTTMRMPMSGRVRPYSGIGVRIPAGVTARMVMRSTLRAPMGNPLTLA
ncbi:hypothetical protein [Ferrimicrobium sp.]